MNIIPKSAALIISIAFLLTLGACTAKQTSAANSAKAADFTVETINGEKITLSDILKSKKAVLVFWTTWCSYCAKEIPAIERFYKEKAGAVGLIAINLQESKPKVKAFAERKGMSYPIGLDPDGNVGGLYNVRGVPTIIAVNKNSEILYHGHSIEDMEREVNF